MKRWLNIIPVMFLFYFGCADQIVSDCDPVTTPGERKAVFAAIQRDVLTPGCALSGCHSGEFPSFGLNLEEGKAYNNLVGVSSILSSLKRVEPGDSQNSYLIEVLNGVDGFVMPPAGKLPQATIDSIAVWIDEGALNN